MSKRGIDHIGVGCVALAHDGKGNLLLQKRGQQARDERGAWDLCGGAIEFGDTIEETLRKELFEELCVEPTDTEFLVAYDAHRVQSGINTSELGWFTSKTLPKPLRSQFQKSFQVAKRRGIIK